MAGIGDRAAALRTNLRAWQIGLFFVALGALGLYLSSVYAGPHGLSPADSTLREAGALLFVTGALSVVWDLHGRRQLTQELLDAAQISTDVRSAGLTRITTHYTNVEWDDLLDNAHHVDLFFAYARSWRGTHRTALARLVERGGRLRVVLPDVENAILMKAMAAKFGYSAETLRDHIQDAENDLLALQRAAGSPDREIRRTSAFPVYTYYRFDRRCVLVLYSLAGGRTEIPTFQSEQGGTLASFLRDQFDKVWDEAHPLPSEA